MKPTDDLLAIIGRAKDLPSLPQVVSYVLDVMDDARSGAKDVAKALEEDPALTTKVLRVANSPLYASPVEITSVHFAIARLGMGEVRNIVITTGVVGAMNRRGGGGLDYAVFWRHCLFVAAAARAVAEHAARSNPAIDPRDPAHFVAGLLHDIGILVLDQTVHSVYEDVLRHVRDTGEPLHLVERRVLGVDHQDVGRLICERWHLPAAVAVTARYHHQPWDADEKTRASALVTYAAEQIGTAMDPAPFHGSADPLWLERVSGALNLSDGNMDSLTDKVRAALDQSETLRAMLTDS